MEKQFFFVSGMPRAGSTILCNILAQNPRFHATQTSGCLDVMYGIRNQWDKLVEHQAKPNPQALKRVLQATLWNYYADVLKPIVFDKSRGWIAYIEMLETVLQAPIKILVPVRPLPNIIASFEKLHRETAKVKQSPGENENYFLFQTTEGRTQYWMQPNAPVGLALNRVMDAIRRGHQKKLHFVNFHDLTINPDKKLKEIYEFLGEPAFQHNFDNVEQVTWEDDAVHGYINLHTIKPKVQPPKNDAIEVLGQDIVERLRRVSVPW